VAAQALRLDHLALLVVEPDGGSARLAEQLGLATAISAALEALTLGPAGGVLGAALAAGEQLIIEDLRTQPGWGQLGAALDQAGLRGAWLLPFLSADGVVQGALLALAARSGRPDPEMLELGQRYARHAALALAGSRRRSADLQAARAEALVQLARTIPHELSQPLAVIAGYAELIGNEQLSGEQLREACLDILTATRELSNRVQRLERVSRYETREFGPGRTLIDLDRATT
jgi:signal transduction histidine kinase